MTIICIVWSAIVGMMVVLAYFLGTASIRHPYTVPGAQKLPEQVDSREAAQEAIKKRIARLGENLDLVQARGWIHKFYISECGLYLAMSVTHSTRCINWLDKYGIGWLGHVMIFEGYCEHDGNYTIDQVVHVNGPRVFGLSAGTEIRRFL